MHGIYIWEVEESIRAICCLPFTSIVILLSFVISIFILFLSSIKTRIRASFMNVVYNKQNQNLKLQNYDYKSSRNESPISISSWHFYCRFSYLVIFFFNWKYRGLVFTTNKPIIEMTHRAWHCVMNWLYEITPINNIEKFFF